MQTVNYHLRIVREAIIYHFWNIPNDFKLPSICYREQVRNGNKLLD